jgi:nucleotide-binding universal stress UspA family protein
VEALARYAFRVGVREELVSGDEAAEEIVGYAKHRHSDLIVLATHGHGALRRALVGSLASTVARSATCPVLLVPPTLWSRAGEGAGSEAAAAVA